MCSPPAPHNGDPGRCASCGTLWRFYPRIALYILGKSQIYHIFTFAIQFLLDPVRFVCVCSREPVPFFQNSACMTFETPIAASIRGYYLTPSPFVSSSDIFFNVLRLFCGYLDSIPQCFCFWFLTKLCFASLNHLWRGGLLWL